MVIDFGAHLYPEAVFPDVIKGGDLDELLESELRDPATLRRQYDPAGIDSAVLSQPYYMGSSDVDATAGANDVLLDIISEQDLYGLAAIPVTAGGEEAAAEFSRSLDRGYNGGAIETETDGVELINEQLEPVFEVAAETGAPILVHPKLNDSVHPDALDDRWMLNAIFGREVALCESICKVIHEGILDSYPGLNLVFHHLGGNIAGMLGRIHLQLDEGRWPGQEHVKNSDEFMAQLQSQVYIDTSGFFGYEEPLRTALDVFPASNVLFGTDYPFEPRGSAELERFVEAVRSVAGPDAEAILNNNVRDLLVNV